MNLKNQGTITDEIHLSLLDTCKEVVYNLPAVVSFLRKVPTNWYCFAKNLPTYNFQMYPAVVTLPISITKKESSTAANKMLLFRPLPVLHICTESCFHRITGPETYRSNFVIFQREIKIHLLQFTLIKTKPFDHYLCLEVLLDRIRWNFVGLSFYPFYHIYYLPFSPFYAILPRKILHFNLVKMSLNIKNMHRQLFYLALA